MQNVCCLQDGLGMERMALGTAANGAHQQPQQVHVRPGPEGTPPHRALGRTAHIQAADEGYFNSYGYFDIHRTMLADRVRSFLLHPDMHATPPCCAFCGTFAHADWPCMQKTHEQ